jgi:hypothetical protein
MGPFKLNIMKNLILIILSILLCISCKKDKTEVKTTGDIIVSSKILGGDTNYYVEGFSFEKGATMKYSLTSGTKPDIVLENNLEENSANIVSPSNNEAFFLADEFESLEAAQTYYDNLKDFSNATFIAKATNIKAFQVYIFQTLTGKYAKFLIKDLKVFTEPSAYVEISIEWNFQPDGSTTFP